LDLRPYVAMVTLIGDESAVALLPFS